MVSAIRMARRERQKAHIPSKLAFDFKTRRYIPNPEIKKEVKSGTDRAAGRLKTKGKSSAASSRS